MSISLTIYLLLAEMLIVTCAPKFGHLFFDPLLFEADEHEEKVGIFRKKMYEELSQPKREYQPENISDEDFLENKDYSEDRDESTTIKDNTNPEIQFSPDNDKEIIKTAEVETPTLLNKQTSNVDTENIIIYPTTDREDDSKLSNSFSLPIRILRNKEADSVIKSGYDYDMQICTLINGVIMCGYNKNNGPIESDQQITVIENGCKIRGDRLECGYDRPSNATGDSPIQILKSNFNSKITHILSSQSQETKEQDSNTDAVSLRQIKSISSLFCTDCRATTRRDTTTEVVTTPATETTSATSTFTPSSTLASTTTKEEPTTHEVETTKLSTPTSTTTKEELTTHVDEKTKSLSTIEMSTSTFVRSTPEAETEGVKKSKQNLRKNTRRNNEQKYTNDNEKLVERTVTRCVEKGDRIVCYKIKDAKKPLK